MDDQHFTALADEHRREILQTLLTESPRRLHASTSDAPERAIALHHTHLPHLEDVGLIEWETETDMIRRGPEFGNLEPLLEFLTTRSLAASD